MEKSRKIFVSALLLLVSMEICLAQHWSFGLQPGGKRNAEQLVEPLQEIASELDHPGEAQEMECPGSHPRFQLGGLQEAVNVLERLQPALLGRNESTPRLLLPRTPLAVDSEASLLGGGARRKKL